MPFPLCTSMYSANQNMKSLVDDIHEAPKLDFTLSLSSSEAEVVCAKQVGRNRPSKSPSLLLQLMESSTRRRTSVVDLYLPRPYSPPASIDTIPLAAWAVCASFEIRNVPLE